MRILMLGFWSFWLIQTEETLYLPHFSVKDGEWETQITLQNPTSVSQRCLVSAFDNDGLKVGETTWTLPGDGAIHDDLLALIPDLTAEVGWLNITTQSQQISGTMTFTSVVGGSASLPFGSNTASNLSFPLLVNNENWTSGFVLLNPESVPTSVRIQFYQPNGVLFTEKQVTLSGGQKLVTMLAPFLNSDVPEFMMMRLSATFPIMGFGLRFAKGLNQIVAIPSETWSPGLLPELRTAVNGIPTGNRMTGFSLGITAESDPVVAASGLADIHNDLTIKPSHAIRIGSLSKSFIAALIFQLVEEDLLQLSDTVDTWWLSFPRGAEISVEMLLRHRSGIPDLFITGINGENPFIQAILDSVDEDKSWTYEEVITFGTSHSFLFDPGTKGQYSNTGYLLLAWILERVSDKPLHQLLEERLFEPFDLRQTFLLEHKRPGIEVSQAYLRDDQGWFGDTGLIQDISGRLNMSFTHGPGGIASTAEDLMKWGRALLGGSVLSAQSLAIMLTPQLVSGPSGGRGYFYGCGLYALNQNGQPVTSLSTITGFGHSGATWGGTAFFYTSTDAKRSLALLSNQYFGDTSSVKSLGFSLLNNSPQPALAPLQGNND